MNDLLIRTASGALYIALLLGSLLWSKIAFLIVVFVFGVLVSLEYCRLNKFPVWVGIPLLAVIAGVLHWVVPSWVDPTLIVSFNIVVNLALLYWLFKADGVLIPALKPLVFLGYLCLGIGSLSLLPLDNEVFNYKVVIAVFLMLWANDSFAYLVGRNFGKTKLMERVSPKKTVEGFLGGALGAIGIGIAAHMIYGVYGLWNWIILAVIVVVFGTLGDLVQSKMKREAGVKDSGVIMPGHGGLYDRMDSLIYAAPFVYIFLILNCYVS